MNKRIVQILVGSGLSLYGVLISIISKMDPEFPISVIISGYLLGVIGLYLIIYAFLRYYR